MHLCAQGINFLDVMYSILTHRQDNIAQDMLDAQMQPWLELLLQLVDITGSSPEQLLKLFLSGKQPIIKKYRHVSQKYVSILAQLGK